MRAVLALYDLPHLESFSGIAEGVENSNFLLRFADGSQRIFTILEARARLEDVPYYVGLMGHLAVKGIACPEPILGRNGSAVQALPTAPQKACVMVSFLPGHGMVGQKITQTVARQLGEVLARMHLAGKDYPNKRANDLSLGGWRRLYEKTAQRADEVERGLAATIGEELQYQMNAWPVATMPSGPIHADLFPDNVFYDQGRLCGVIDFYFACNDLWAYDLAITINAWCFNVNHQLDSSVAKAMLVGYESVRPLTDAERESFQTLARGASLRFLLTRLHDWLFPVEGALVTAKNPLEYLAKLRFHRENTLLEAVKA